MSDGTNCNNPINLHRYVEEFTCSNSAATDRMLKDMRLSFPSGHSSFGFYTMIFCAVSLLLKLFQDNVKNKFIYRSSICIPALIGKDQNY